MTAFRPNPVATSPYTTVLLHFLMKDSEGSDDERGKFEEVLGSGEEGADFPLAPEMRNDCTCFERCGTEAVTLQDSCVFDRQPAILTCNGYLRVNIDEEVQTRTSW